MMYIYFHTEQVFVPDYILFILNCNLYLNLTLLLKGTSLVRIMPKFRILRLAPKLLRASEVDLASGLR